jgi:hypothetical protein
LCSCSLWRCERVRQCCSCKIQLHCTTKYQWSEWVVWVW